MQEYRSEIYDEMIETAIRDGNVTDYDILSEEDKLYEVSAAIDWEDAMIFVRVYLLPDYGIAIGKTIHKFHPDSEQSYPLYDMENISPKQFKRLEIFMQHLTETLELKAQQCKIENENSVNSIINNIFKK